MTSDELTQLYGYVHEVSMKCCLGVPLMTSDDL